jgi:hypothetical protein
MRKIIFILTVICCLYGCAGAGQTERLTPTLPGNLSAQIGIVDVYKKMKYGGSIVEERLAVKVDENGNIALLSGESSSNEVSIFLAADERNELTEKLLLVQKVGDPALRNDSEPTTYIGGVVGNRGCLLSGRIDLRLDFLEYGYSWVCVLKISGYDIFTMVTPHMGTPQNKRDVNLLLPPEAVENLLLLLEKAHAYP